ncbi:MAG: hypothetical protein ACI9V1_003230 [Spirosomataceae bacterium]
MIIEEVTLVRHRQEAQVLTQDLLLQAVRHIRGLRHVVILLQEILQTGVIRHQVEVRLKVEVILLQEAALLLVRTQHQRGRVQAQAQAEVHLLALVHHREVRDNSE